VGVAVERAHAGKHHAAALKALVPLVIVLALRIRVFGSGEWGRREATEDIFFVGGVILVGFFFVKPDEREAARTAGGHDARALLLRGWSKRRAVVLVDGVRVKVLLHGVSGETQALIGATSYSQ
jgi:hypothetical protein